MREEINFNILFTKYIYNTNINIKQTIKIKLRREKTGERSSIKLT